MVQYVVSMEGRGAQLDPEPPPLKERKIQANFPLWVVYLNLGSGKGRKNLKNSKLRPKVSIKVSLLSF